MATCELCGCHVEQPVERPADIFFRTILCGSCWSYETECGVKRDFDIMAGHHVGDMFDEDGKRIDQAQILFEAEMPTIGLCGLAGG